MRYNILFICSIVLILHSNYIRAQESLFLSQGQKELFTKRTKEKVKELGLNISTIGDKTVNLTLRKETVNSTVNLFLSADNFFEISSKYRTTKTRNKIRDYLNRLIALTYIRVQIEWYDVHFITNLRQGPDGKYYGVVRIFQKFRGFGLDNQLLYEDTTSKDIEIVIEIVKIDLGHKHKEFFEVKLGNVRVHETK